MFPDYEAFCAARLAPPADAPAAARDPRWRRSRFPRCCARPWAARRRSSASGANVGEVLRDLASSHPATQSQLFSAEGELNRYVNVYLNDEDVRVLDGLDTAVGEGDTLVILPAMAGGRAERGLSPRRGRRLVRRGRRPASRLNVRLRSRPLEGGSTPDDWMAPMRTGRASLPRPTGVASAARSAASAARCLRDARAWRSRCRAGRGARRRARAAVHAEDRRGRDARCPNTTRSPRTSG